MISFRAMQPEDKEMIRRWRNLPQIRRYMLTDHEIGPEEHAAWFAKVLGNPCYRHWIIVCDEEDVGLLNLYDLDSVNRRCYWGFYVAAGNVRGKNVGMFAEYFVLEYVFRELQLDQLCCETLDFNRAVLRMHEAFGFVKEGGLRRRVVKGGEAHDVICMAIRQSEWEKKRPEFERIFRAKGLI
jgi:UDP-4-amino-4,6-dideoxy-N-acetyl-beta-L-altrosamine N-acetyltransferase